MSKVYLIGAGPGNEELITLRAINVLKKCTAVMYDRLAGPGILKHLNENCKILYCGKEPGAHYKTQEEINDMLVKLAKEGHIVGRIKGGDPYVFGRGGEEGTRLFEENIEFEVVPGVTSAISVLSYAGIPITNRGLSQSFHVFTGMSAEKLNINWKSAANIEGTLVFLMGLENIEVISDRLLQNGKSEETPCAVVMRGTTSKQKKITGNLKNIAKIAREAELKSPCIIVMGEVVKLSSTLGWYEKKPLFGQNVCVTRSKEQSQEVCEKLIDLGAEVTEMNSIKIHNTSDNLKYYINNLHTYDYIVLTSVNSVNIFFDYLIKKEYDIRNLKAKFAVIGLATKRALLRRGIKAEIMAKEFVSESLFENLKAVVKEGDKVLIPQSINSRKYIGENLRKIGLKFIDEVYIYETVKGDNFNISAFPNVDYIFFTSPTTVENMCDMVGVDEIKKKTCIAIGPITEKSLLNKGIQCYVSKEHSTDGMIEKLKELVKK